MTFLINMASITIQAKNFNEGMTFLCILKKIF